MKLIRYILAVVMFALLIAGVSFPKVAYESKDETEISKSSDTFTVFGAKDSLDRYLDELAKYECVDCAPHYRRLDSNGYYSYSCLQFQKATFDEMEDKYIPADIIEKAGADRIYDCEYQKVIARAMWLYTGRATARHWFNSVYTRGLGLPMGY